VSGGGSTFPALSQTPQQKPQQSYGSGVGSDVGAGLARVLARTSGSYVLGQWLFQLSLRLIC